MKLFQLAWLILESACLTVVPQYRSGVDATVAYSDIPSQVHVLQSGNRSVSIQLYSPGRFVDRYQNFGLKFSQTPEIIMSIFSVDYAPVANGYELVQNSISTTGFNIKFIALQSSTIFGIYIQYLALVDDNIQISYAIINTTISTNISCTFNFPQPFSTVPNGAIFLYGIDIVNVVNSYYIQWVQIGVLTMNTYELTVVAMNGFVYDYVSVAIIAGPSKYLITGEYQMSSFGIANLGSIDETVKVYTVGIVGLQVSGYANVCLGDSSSINSSNNVIVNFWKCNIQNILYQRVSYYFYKPCASYCNQCPTSNSVILCNSCKAQTLRINPPSCVCPSQYYEIATDVNCQPCDNYCDGCFGTSVNCTLCSAITQRLSPPSCSTCPSLMFIQAGIDDCQYCASYCDQCINSQTICLACQASTQRMNPPLCVMCPTQYFLITNIVNCQACKSYCDQCSTSDFNCMSCKSLTMRSNPPSCLTCPSQMFTQENLINCQTCVPYCDNCYSTSTNCVACQLFTKRSKPPNCQTCPPGMFLDNSDCELNGKNNLSSCQCKKCFDQCKECFNDKFNCLTCNLVSHRINPPECSNCPKGMYSSYGILNCQPCSDNCSNCQDQSGECTECVSDNYYIKGQQCIHCPNACQTSNQKQCLLCNKLSIMINNTCECQFPCSRCDNNKCITCISSDYRIYNNMCQYCPERCFACDQDGHYLMQPQHCQIGVADGNKVKCQKCSQNYYLDNNTICIQCSKECLECIDSPNNCTKCRFTQLNNDNSYCSLCESKIGFYSNFTNNNCYTICGDGVTAGNEQCDDDNTQSNDGCTNCQIDSGYVRTENSCYPIIYLIPQIGEINSDIYNNFKDIILDYNTPIINQDIYIQVNIDPNINFSFNITKIDQSQFLILLNLQEQSLNAQVTITFVSPSQILSNQGQYQKIQTISQKLSNYLKLQVTEQQIMNSTDNITKILRIMLIVIICIAVLLGGLEVFWNLLDLLQTICYLKYINTMKPQYLFEFLNLFNFLQFSNLPLNQLFSIQNFVQNKIEINSFATAPDLISNDQYTTSTIINSIPITIVFITAFLIYCTAYLILKLIKNHDVKYNLSYNLNSFRTNLYKIKFYIIKNCDTVCKEWIWSGFFRVCISSAYEMSFTIALGVYGVEQKNTLANQSSKESQSTNLLKLDCMLTLVVLTLYLLMIYTMLIILAVDCQTLKYAKYKFGAVYQDLNLKYFAKYYTIIVTIKKFLFMIFLVLFYDEAIFQAINILLLQMIQLLFLLVIEPIQEKKQRYKQIICEFLMVIAKSQLLLLVLSDYYQLLYRDNRKIYSWICIFALMLMILTQLYIDLCQQYRMYYVRYAFVRNIAKRFECKRSNQITKCQFQDFII